MDNKLPCAGDDEKLAALQGIMRDAMDCLRIEDRLRESERHYRLLAENVADVIWTVGFADPTRLTYVSPSITRLLGYTVEEAIATPMEKVFTPASYSIALKGLAEALSEERQESGRRAVSRTMELELRHKNLSIVPVEASYSLIRESDGSPAEILAVVRDISERKKAERVLQLNAEKLMKSMQDMVQAMAMIVELRDPYTAGHQRRVAQLACALGSELRLSEERLTGLRLAAAVHDVGKVRVPTEILTNPNGLSDAEFAIVKTHPLVGWEIIKTIDLPWPVSTIVHQHHERLDGSGYPSGLRKEDIILEARILAVADVVDAICSHRPYRPSLGIEKALQHISFEKGRLYDSNVVDACMTVFRSRGFSFAK
jgi:PAS domain S-box-containing protein